jgi:hypothetical protein
VKGFTLCICSTTLLRSDSSLAPLVIYAFPFSTLPRKPRAAAARGAS